MGLMDRWEVGLLVLAAYVGVMALVRLMMRRRAKVFAEVEAQVAVEQQRQKKQAKAAAKKRDAA